MKILILLLALLSTSAWALTLKTPDKQYTFVEKGELRVSESCLKEDCLALKPAFVKSTDKPKSKYVGHPAAILCAQQDGEYITGKRESGDEDGLCLFKDKSYILGWDYYKKNQSKAAQ